MEKGKALETYLNGDRKLLLESDALLRKTVQLLLQENPDVVLIPGDLTKDGELVSHLGVAELLKPLREKGIKVLVIPGNHDINNPNAVAFHGDRVQRWRQSLRMSLPLFITITVMTKRSVEMNTP